MKALKIAAICSLLTGITFGIFSLIFYFGDWIRFTIVFSFGLFLGLIAAPEFEPKAFKRAWLFQLTSGIISGLLVGLFFHLNTEYIFVSAAVGGLLGWSAPYWVKYV